MADEQTFLDEIVANPDDDLPRLIYADWLEEQGNPRGEFIRVQCELASLKKTQVRYRELRAREQELWTSHGAEWVKGFPYSLRRCVFRRGFIEESAIALSYFVRNWSKIGRLTPLRHVTFTQVQNRVKLLEDCPGLELLRSIRLKNCYPNLDTTPLARSPHLKNIETIIGRWSDRGLIELSKSTVTGNLRILIPEGQFSVGAVEALADAPQLKLRHLNVSYGIPMTAVPVIARARFGQTLEELVINGVDITDEEFITLMESPSLPVLKDLRASNMRRNIGVHGPGLEALAKNPRLANLRYLSLTNHPLSFRSLEALGSSQYRVRGTKFHFGFHRSDMQGPLTKAQVEYLRVKFGRTFGNF
ncbi:MAG: TIGR02996 domain-containing protein [Planctomycetaceae bacterium]